MKKIATSIILEKNLQKEIDFRKKQPAFDCGRSKMISKLCRIALDVLKKEDEMDAHYDGEERKKEGEAKNSPKLSTPKDTKRKFSKKEIPKPKKSKEYTSLS